MRFQVPFTCCALVAAASLAACGGGSGGTSGGGVGPPVVQPTSAPTTTPTTTPTTAPATQQVVTMALPSSAMGSVLDPTFGAVGGYTQALYSQTLAFAPGSQIMVRNGQAAAIPHTLGVISTSAASGFTANPPLSLTASGGSTIGAGFNTGTIAAGALAGPFTLAAGTYWLGCAYHYSSDAMRTVLVVAAGATPGPQATPAPSKTAPPPGNGY
jgi:hypothetical protein